MRKTLSTVLVWLIPFSVSFGQTLFIDLNPGMETGVLQLLNATNDQLYFFANDTTDNYSLWKTDGAPAGTVKVRPMHPDGGTVFASESIVLNDTLYFGFRDYNTGNELWKTDGTIGGTKVVKDIRPGNGDGAPHLFTLFSNAIYLIANAANYGAELWRSDGSEEGTYMVKDIKPGSSSSTASTDQIVEFNGRIYFNANDGTNGVEPWSSDGTTEGTTLLQDIEAGSGSSYASEFCLLNDRLLFTANNSATGLELYISDGTSAGTFLLSDINPFGSSDPQYLKTCGDHTYFFADDGVHGFELWKTDGTASGTQMVKEINEGISGSFPLSPDRFECLNELLFFTALSDTFGQELFVTDGSLNNTKLLLDINSTATQHSFPTELKVYADHIVFSVDDGVHGFELWQTDGASAETMMLTDIFSGPGDALPYWKTIFDSSLYFLALDGAHGQEIWKYNNANNIDDEASEINFSNHNSVSPNPSNGNFSIDLSGFKHQNLTVDLIDQLGHLVQRQQVQQNNADDLLFHCSSCTNQLYFLKVQSAAGSFVSKVIITK